MSRTHIRSLQAAFGSVLVPQRTLTANGNEAAAFAAQQFHAETCPIRFRSMIPSGKLAERTYEILDAGQAFVALMEAAEELNLRRGAGSCGDWAADNDSRPAVWNMPLRDGLSLELSGKFDFLQSDPDTGPLLLFAFDQQEVYDMNVVGAKLARQTSRLVIILSDGETTEHERAKIEVFANGCALRAVVEPPQAPTHLHHTHVAAGFSSLDMDSKTHWSGDAVLQLVDQLLAEFEALTGHRYRLIEEIEGHPTDTALVVLNPPKELVKRNNSVRGGDDCSPGILLPRILRPFPHDEARRLLSRARSVSVIERGMLPAIAQYVAAELRQAPGWAGTGRTVSIRSFGDVDAADVPAMGDETWSFLEGLRLSSATRA